jgi:hypothetical protein
MDSRILPALKTAEPVKNLVSLVHRLKAEGLNQLAVPEVFEQAR